MTIRKHLVGDHQLLYRRTPHVYLFLLYYLGGFGNEYDAYKYSELVNPETGEREEKTYDPMDKVVKRN